MIRRFKKYYNIDNAEVIPPPPPPEEDSCINWKLEASSPTTINFTFHKCSGGTATITVPGNTSVNVCAVSVNPPAFASNKWKIYIGDYC